MKLVDFYKVFDDWHCGLNQLKKFNKIPIEWKIHYNHNKLHWYITLYKTHNQNFKCFRIKFITVKIICIFKFLNFMTVEIYLRLSTILFSSLNLVFVQFRLNFFIASNGMFEECRYFIHNFWLNFYSCFNFGWFYSIKLFSFKLKSN